MKGYTTQKGAFNPCGTLAPQNHNRREVKGEHERSVSVCRNSDVTCFVVRGWENDDYNRNNNSDSNDDAYGVYMLRRDMDRF